MSSTRHAPEGAPLRQERYMSSPEYANRRGLLGNLVAQRCELLDNESHRSLIYFLQALSHRAGGLDKVAERLLLSAPRIPNRSEQQPRLRDHLVDLCLNPASRIDSFLGSFPKLPTALLEYQKAYSAAVQKQTYVTGLGKQIEKTLDFALKAKCMVLLEGNARTGKSFASKAWCEAKLGQARYLQVPSSNDDLGFFRAIAKGLGLSHASTLKGVQLRERIEDTLQTAHLMIVFDEAHYLWPQRNAKEALPQKINWIMTALVNYGVPVALVTTPQFAHSQKQVEKRTGWTSEQFIGRISSYRKLPKELDSSDLESVAKVKLPEGDRASIKMLVGYAKFSAKYLAAMDAAVKQARYLAQEDGREKVTFDDIEKAINEGVIPSDQALAQTLSEPAKNIKTHRKSMGEMPFIRNR